jgi:acetyl-CoA carboxylase biotin carboxyl carrier protein
MELTHDDVKKILEIIDGATHLDQIEVVYGGFHLRAQRGRETESSVRDTPPLATTAPRSSAPSPSPATARPPQRAEPTLGEGELAVRAPMLGTFYRAQTPGAPPFVEVGQRVRADDTVCLIEVMKLFNSVKAGVDGVVMQILAENAKLVEYNEVLIVISTVT